MRVPGEERKFLIKRHELLYTEVTASNLVKVSMDDDLDEKAGVNRPGFTLHGGVLSGRPDVNAAVHVHTSVSTGSLSPEQVVEQAEKLGLDAVLLSDNFVQGAWAHSGCQWFIVRVC